MKITDYFAFALNALITSKKRVILSILGVAIGIAGVLSCYAIVNGTSQQVIDSLESMNPNVFTVSFSGDSNIGVQDVKNLEQKNHISNVTRCADKSIRLYVMETSITTKLRGIDENYLKIFNIKVEEGRDLTEATLQTNSVIIGRKVALKLFGRTDNILNEKIYIKSSPFIIVGVIEEQGSSFEWDEDNVVYISYSTYKKNFSEDSNTNLYISAISSDTDDINLGIWESESYFLNKQLIQNKSSNILGKNFFIFSSNDDLATLNESKNLFALLLIGVASISLIVSSIGIININLVAVSERTKEIGICIANGASEKNIMFGFLLESIIITFIGGVIGLLFGVATSVTLSNFMNITPFINIKVLIVILLTSLLIGLVSGIYPALKAAKLKPVDTLRY